MPKTSAKGYAAKTATSPLEPFDFERRELRPHDVQIKIQYCGVCHSDIHTARNEWKSTIYPTIPGHEIVGQVMHVGKDVHSFHVGDTVAVGCMVDSCRKCVNCVDNQEQYCDKGCIYTYNSQDLHDKTTTYGGYSNQIVVDENFVLHIPSQFKKEKLANVAPLLCAGITTYSPLRHWKVGKHSKVGVVGLGGLGHMAIKLAAAMGAHVVLFTRSPGKSEDAKKFGAKEVVISTNEEEMKQQSKSFDFILNTVAASHNLDPFLQLLKREGTMCMVGAPELPHPSPTIFNLIGARRSLAGSLIGGIKETQEMLDFCAKHDITCDIEMIPISKINEAYERMLKSDVKYRFVIDTSSIEEV